MTVDYLALGVRFRCALHLPFARARVSAHEDALAHELTLASPPETDLSLLVHEAPDFPGGPVLRIFMDDRADRAFIDYAGWRASLDPGENALVIGATREDTDVSLPQLLERVVFPIHAWLANPDALALHGSSVRWEGRAVALMGQSGAGKSSAAAALIELGCDLVADDLSLLDTRTGHALPGAPSLRLWDGAADTSRALRSEPILGLDDKRWYLMPHTPLGEPVPLRGVLLLRRDPSAPTTGLITPLEGLAALTAILGQSFDLDRPPTSWSRRRIAAASALCKRVPISTLTFSAHPERRPEHAIAALEWLREVI